MKLLLSTILLTIVLLPPPSLSQTEVQNPKLFKSDTATASELANESLKLLKSNQDLSSALIFIEQSLFKNPYNLKAYQVRSKIYDKLNYTSDRIPLTAYILEAFPVWLSLLLFALSFFWCAKNWGFWYNSEKKFSSVEESLKIKSYLSLFLSLIFLICFFGHLSLNKKNWACIVSDSTPLKTGPATSSNTQRNLNTGVCFSPSATQGDWTSLTASELRGWVRTESLRTVR